MLNAKTLVTVALILFSIAGCNGRHKHKRKIVKGFSIDVIEAPFQASIEAIKNGTYKNICGGSILSATWILTAAHCILLSEDMPNKRVMVGRSMMTSGGVVHTIKRLIPHPLYQNYYKYDIGLLELNEPIAFSIRAKPVMLPAHSPEVGAICKSHGFGRLELDGPSPSYLQAVWVVTRKPEECKKWVPQFEESSVFCTNGHEEFSGFCNGDSGGPLTCTGVQYGISSYKPQCDPEKPDYYTDVYKFLDFIKAYTNL